MAELILLVGPPGSGKSTLAKEYVEQGYVRINQDEQGKQHLDLFHSALHAGSNIIVDRMGFSKAQRDRYIQPALLSSSSPYKTKIIVLHEPRKKCLERMINRQNHPTIKNVTDANNALNTFFSKYERPLPGEAEEIEFRYPEGSKDLAVICDLDGTLCNIDHRYHFVDTNEKKNWKLFFQNLDKDVPNEWCSEILQGLWGKYDVVFASGRPDDYYHKTKEWLDNHWFPTNHLYMRCRGDHRQDYIAKEIILDFEILTRFKPLFFIDDRKQVVDLWRRRGYTCLACAEGNF